MHRLIILAAILFVLCGCGEKKIDSSNDETFRKSIEAVERSLSDDKKKNFDAAVQAIAFAQVGNIFESAANPESMQKGVKDSLNGKTADVIIAEGNKILLEQKKQQTEQIMAEIKEINVKLAELKERKLQVERDKEQLKQVEVLRSRFYFNNDNSFMTQAVIELTVKNNTKFPIARAYFHGILATPGRSVPWVDDVFNYEIAGGLEPGEEATWQLSPNMFGAWSNAPKDRNDMVLTVSVTRIDGADQKPIFNADFSDDDRAQLEQLTNRLTELQKNSM